MEWQTIPKKRVARSSTPCRIKGSVSRILRMSLILPRFLSLSFLFFPKGARLNRIGVLPKSASGRAGLVLSFRVALSIFRSLLSLIVFVVPGHAGLHLFQVNFLPLQPAFSAHPS